LLLLTFSLAVSSVALVEAAGILPALVLLFSVCFSSTFVSLLAAGQELTLPVAMLTYAELMLILCIICYSGDFIIIKI
jgi:hypothetical protein